MDANTADAVKKDFLAWSGGFPPNSEQEILVYMEYAFGAIAADPNEVREMLREWMCNNDDDICPFS